MRYTPILLFSIFLAAGCSGQKSLDYQVFCKTSEKVSYYHAYDEALKLWNTPYEEQDIATNYGIAHVITAGPKNGEPVVLFHGMDASSTMWYPNVKALTLTHRVYAIDFPFEAGKSVACRSKLSNDDIVGFYNEVFDHFKMNYISLIGASRGGWVAVNVALKSGSRIKNLVLLSPAQTIGGMKSPLKVITAIKLKLIPNRKRLARFFDAFSVHPDRIDDHYKEQFYQANLYGDSKPRYLDMQQFSQKKLRTLKIPVLILAGDHDIVNDNKALTRAHELFPDVETEMIKDAGHFLSIDQSTVINQRILEFLKKNDADNQFSSIQKP